MYISEIWSKYVFQCRFSEFLKKKIAQFVQLFVNFSHFKNLQIQTNHRVQKRDRIACKDFFLKNLKRHNK